MRKTLPLSLLLPVLAGSLAMLTLRAAPPDAPTPTPQAVTPSAMERDPAGWIDLLPHLDSPDPNARSWHRHPYAGKQLVEPDPWSRKAGEDVLRCARLPMAGEQFLCDTPFSDGVFHVEWRFAKVEGGQGYNSGVFVRNSTDGTVWHQAQVGSLNVGYLFGATLKDGKVQRFKIDDQVPPRGKPAGEWNTYEITCRGKNITLWINGAVTATWTDCEVPRGWVGLEAEGWEIEFRNVKFKEKDPAS